MAGIIPYDEVRRLQKRMNRLMEDLGLSDFESKSVDEMQKLQKRMNELMEEAEKTPLDRSVMMPLADMKETDESLIVTMDLPGIEKEDVDISIAEDELRVVAERKTEAEVLEKDFHKRERTYRKFERILKLPVAVKVDEASASLKEGVLEITLPKEVVTAKTRITID
ncbi:MAG: Hsp20/alpha crystallin family protein [Methanotrichaceae archaeon]|nr:Hsp20/alpha crystallin family protein [Methanotrichaceae archaeon]